MNNTVDDIIPSIPANVISKVIIFCVILIIVKKRGENYELWNNYR